MLDRQGSWRVVQTNGWTVKSLFLERDGSDARSLLATVEVPSATVTNVYWDEFAGWDAEAGRAVGGMVTNVDTVAGEYTFHAFVNDGNVYWEDRADGVPRLWTAPCKSPETKTLLATGDAGCPTGTSAFGAEPWNRGAAWTEAGADGGTMVVFENGATTRLSGEAALAARKNAPRDGKESYETDYGYVDSGSWFPPYSGWQSEFHDRQTVLIPDGVERIGMGVFANCTNMESVTIPDSVTSIGWGAFLGCSGLTDATIPDSVTDIDAAAFRQCSGMTNLLIGEGVTRIGYYAFDGCRSLASVTILGNVASDWAILDESHDYRLFKNCTNLSTFVLGEKMTKIGNYMFSGCSGLTSVTIPDGVTSIGNRAFSGCSGLTSVTIPDSVTRIGDMVFSGCNGLKTLYVPAEWEGTDMLSDADVPSSCTVVYAAAEGHVDETGWSYVVQGGKAKVTGGPAEGMVEIPSVLGGYPVTSIGNGAFSDSTGLTGVTIPGSVTRIGDKAFSGCSGLTSVTVPDSVTTLGTEAFSGCSNLASVTILGNVQSDWNDWEWEVDWAPPPFSHCPNLATVVLGGEVTKIGNYMFYGCSGLTSVIIGDSVTSIGDEAFYLCSGLTSVTIPDSVTSIGDYAFRGCSGLTSVTIGDSVTSIGDEAFSGCSGLTRVTIGDSVTSIGDYAFYGCSGLKTLSVPGAWEGTTMLANAKVPEGCVVVYRKGEGDLLPEVEDEAGVTAALAGARDDQLKERIQSVDEYEEFRAWVSGKSLDAAAVMESEHAWISYALGAEGLFENEPEIVLSGMSVGRDGAKETESGVAVEVSVTVKDGKTEVPVDASKVAGMFEATGDLGNWGKPAKLSVTVRQTGKDGATMRFQVIPGDGTASEAFLRIAP